MIIIVVIINAVVADETPGALLGELKDLADKELIID